MNRRLNYLGWYDVELDYHTLQLAVARFEEEGFFNLRYIPPTHLNKTALTFKSKDKQGVNNRHAEQRTIGQNRGHIRKRHDR